MLAACMALWELGDKQSTQALVSVLFSKGRTCFCTYFEAELRTPTHPKRNGRQPPKKGSAISINMLCSINLSKYVFRWLLLQTLSIIILGQPSLKALCQANGGVDVFRMSSNAHRQGALKDKTSLRCSSNKIMCISEAHYTEHFHFLLKLNFLFLL